MKAKQFRKAIPERLRQQLPEDLHDFDHRFRFSLVQIWYGDRSFHYEVAPSRKAGTVEIGLHFEHKKSKHNAAMHDFFDQNMLEIRHRLGEIWLEKWDRGWHKLYKTLNFPDYNEEMLATVSEELAQQIIVLQPMLADARRELKEFQGTKGN